MPAVFELLSLPTILVAPFVMAYVLGLAGTSGRARRRVAVAGGVALLLLAAALLAWELAGLQSGSGFG